MVENGLIESDGDDLAVHIQSLKAERTQAVQEIRLLLLAARLSPMQNSPGWPKPCAQQCPIRIRHFVDTVTVEDDEVTMTGPKAALAKSALLNHPPAP